MSNEYPDFLGHDADDAVAVAVRDVAPGESIVGFLDGSPTKSVVVNADIPLGHKVALKEVANGAEVTEYSLPIGTATTDIKQGDYVHTHNVRSARWQNSVA
ncbi:UxaA family hydrolase [Gulosibacter sp. 10]|uniref:UxaA family hydrolase n=1 Tax=Gulosibacter sp. 10 TaxID=1255570 RepID=UPI00097E9E98|nr:UxaA family hydrolase [Gulosibacter sp. 10]SJM64089.1 Altronate dehydratase [Gulosibacter sp. 10]